MCCVIHGCQRLDIRFSMNVVMGFWNAAAMCITPPSGVKTVLACESAATRSCICGVGYAKMLSLKCSFRVFAEVSSPGNLVLAAVSGDHRISGVPILLSMIFCMSSL